MNFKRFAVAVVAFAAVFTAASLARASIRVTFTFASGASLQATATTADTNFNTNPITTHLEIAGWPAASTQLFDHLSSGQTFAASVEVSSGSGASQTLVSTTRFLGAQVNGMSLSFAASGKSITLVETIDLLTPKWEKIAAAPGTAFTPSTSTVTPPALDSGVVTIGATKSAPFSANISFTASSRPVNGVMTRVVTPSPFTFSERTGAATNTLQMDKADGRLVAPFAFDVWAGTTDVYRLVLAGARVTGMSTQSANGVSNDTASMSAGQLPLNGDLRTPPWGFSILTAVP
jgi:hypothetical protein